MSGKAVILLLVALGLVALDATVGPEADRLDPPVSPGPAASPEVDGPGL